MKQIIGLPASSGIWQTPYESSDTFYDMRAHAFLVIFDVKKNLKFKPKQFFWTIVFFLHHTPMHRLHQASLFQWTPTANYCFNFQIPGIWNARLHGVHIEPKRIIVEAVRKSGLNIVSNNCNKKFEGWVLN